MQQRSALYCWSAGIAAAILVVLVMLPATGRIVREQVVEVLSGPLTWWVTPIPTVADQNRAAQEHPDDFSLQLANALHHGPLTTPLAPYRSSTEVVDRLADLSTRFPREAAVQAALLRQLSRDQFNLASRIDHERQDADAVATSGKQGEPKLPPRPETVRQWNDAASAGERLDPNNAFFPMMHAAGLFAQHDDPAACAAIERAGRLPQYDDYVPDEVFGGWRLRQAMVGGDPGSFVRLACVENEDYAYLPVIRDVARVAHEYAIRKERAGDAVGGLEIRQALLRCGDTMRIHASLAIGELVGIAISSIAIARPGGEPSIRRDDLDDLTFARTLGQHYAGYLRTNGRAECAVAIDGDTIGWQSTKSILGVGDADGFWAPGRTSQFTDRYYALVGCHAEGLFVIGSLIMVLIVGLLPEIVDRPRKGVDASKRRHDWASIGVALAVALWMSVGANRYMLDMETVYQPASAETNVGFVETTAICWAALLFVPFVTWLGALVRNGWRRRRLRPLTSRPLERAAAVTGLILVVLYVAASANSARCEIDTRNMLMQMTEHEGRYDAGLVGRAWPDTEPPPCY
jgi:hypothetical protein